MDYSKPTAQMLGRWQPFHDGHKALFIKALEKHGQVCIAIRDAISPAAWPPIPSATAISLDEMRAESSLPSRTRPISVLANARKLDIVQSSQSME